MTVNTIRSFILSKICSIIDHDLIMIEPQKSKKLTKLQLFARKKQYPILFTVGMPDTTFKGIVWCARCGIWKVVR